MTNMFLVLAAEEATGIGALGINLRAILVQAGVFVLLFFLVKKYALGPINKTIDDRAQRIDEGLEMTKQAEERTKKVNQETSELMKQARTESAAIVAQAKQEAQEISDQTEVSTREKAAKIMDDADASIKAQISKAEKSLKADIAKQVRQASEMVVGSKLDSKSDEALIERSLEQIKKESK